LCDNQDLTSHTMLSELVAIVNSFGRVLGVIAVKAI